MANFDSKSSSSFSSDSSTSEKGIKLPSINDFTILKPVSRGAFGKVFLGCKTSKPDQIYAVKVMKKTTMVNKNMIQQVLAERDALAISRSPFIVQLFYSMQSESNIYLIMEYMIGGDLKSLLHVCGCFEESMAVFYIAEAVQALEYLHQHNIVHRDLKPDNMLISATGHMKLTDFGLSKITVKKPIKLTDILGSPSCCNKESWHYLKSRTPGQLMSLTSSLAFCTHKNNSMHVASTASPIFTQRKSLSDQVHAYHETPEKMFIPKFQLENERISSSGMSLLPFQLETPDKLRDGDRLSHLQDAVNTPELKIGLFHTASGNSSSSSCTPYYPKQKRKILHSRSTKNFREMRSSSSAMSLDLNSKRKLKRANVRKVKTDDLTTIELVRSHKRKRSSGSDDALLESNVLSTSLTSVLSELRFEESSRLPQKMPLKKPKNSSSILSNVARNSNSEDSVFFSSPIDCKLGNKKMASTPFGEVLFNMSSVSNAANLRCIHSSLIRDGCSKKKVNFCLGSQCTNGTSDCGGVSHASIGYESESSSIVHHLHSRDSAINISKMSKQNSVFCTPNSTYGTGKRKHSTPLPYLPTPYRTPKSVRRGPEPKTDSRILGTPDYLAPELLLHQEHSFPVDWWALGVCLYEFLTGIPPFNDITAEAVFNNILKRDIPWPEEEEELSKAAKSAIDMLLTFTAKERPGAERLKTWPLFENIEWENILQMQAPFVPVPDSQTDTTYFDARNEMQHLKISNFDL